MKAGCFVVAGVLVLAGCGRPGALTDREMYERGVAAIRAQTNLPPDLAFLPADQARAFAAKSAGSITIPCTFRRPDGAQASASFTVWLKRINMRWEIDRVEPAPVYAASAPGTP